MRMYAWGIIVSLIPVMAQADPVFNGSAVLNTAALQATVASVSTVIMPAGDVGLQGNTISGEAFKGAFGISTVAQNTGANAVVQQAVNFKADSITLSLPH